MKEVKVGASGLHTFPEGYYYYCGSAQNNLQARINRHLSSDKSFHWHIDYLLSESEVNNFYTWPYSGEKECDLANFLYNNLEGKIIVEEFGASDCKCRSHLFYFKQVLLADIICDEF